MRKNKMNLDNLSLSSSEKEVLNQFSDDLSKIGSNDLRFSGVTSLLDVTSSPKKDK